MTEPERTWVRHATSGQRGYLVQRPDGREYVRTDRPNDTTEYPYTPTTWLEEHDYKPMRLAQAARVAFEADRVLCGLLGLHDRARKSWDSLAQREKAMWMEDGPYSPEIREELYDAIMGVVRRYAAP